MRKICLAVCVLVLLCSSVSARTIPGAPNEVRNPYFNESAPGVIDDWYVNGGYVLTPYPPMGNAIGTGGQPGANLFLRTIVDDYEGLWVPEFNNKEIDLSFFGEVAGDGYINFRFDWWNEEQMDRPENDPNSGPPPDGFSPWYSITESGMDPGITTLGPDWLRPGEEILPGYKLYDFHEIWDHQPRFVSIEFDLGVFDGDLNQDGSFGVGVANLTGVDFEAQCVVPEPGSMMFFGFGMLGWLYKKFRK